MELVVMNEFVIVNLESYAARRALVLAERLGFGIHGIVNAAGSNPHLPPTAAIKAHLNAEAYGRERDIYLRLRAIGLRELLGFQVPQILAFDDELRVLEMTIVTRPFVLDFAGAYLESPPEFSDDVWDEWLEQKVDQFGQRWPKVQEVLAALEELDIHMVDVSPSNIAFRD